jgi:hypothetical protein
MTRIGLDWAFGYRDGKGSFVTEPDNLSAFRAAVSELVQRLPDSDRAIATIRDVHIGGVAPEQDKENPQMFTRRFEVGLFFTSGAYPNAEYHSAKVRVNFWYAPGSVSNTIIKSVELDGSELPLRGSSVQVVKTS